MAVLGLGSPGASLMVALYLIASNIDTVWLPLSDQSRQLKLEFDSVIEVVAQVILDVTQYITR